MKKINLFLLVISIFLLTACGNKTITNKNEDVKETYSFVYNDIKMTPGELFSTEKMGNYLNEMELPTCAFEDTDRVYTYENYEISTYTLNNEERILSILITDPNTPTTEGIKQGDSYEKMLEVYGDNYQKLDNLYEYKKDNTLLDIIVENEIVISIEYVYNTNN